MPVDGESSAAVQCSAGSSACACAALSHCRSSTPQARPRAWICASASSLAGTGAHDQLAAALMRDATLGRIGIQPLPALNAQPRLPRPGCVVQAGVDDLAVAGAGGGAEGVGGLQDHDLVAASASARAAARPTTPAPMTMLSRVCIPLTCFRVVSTAQSL
jgi:hypothetical protein